VAEVYVAGTGIHPFGKFPEKRLRDIAFPAVRDALADAEVGVRDVEIAFVGNAYAGLITGQESVRGQTVLRHCGFTDIPIVNVENACASGSTAIFQARLALLSGEYDVALVLGVEKLYTGDTARSIRAIASASDVEDPGLFAMQFTGIYAMKAAEYMARHGATDADLAKVVEKNSAHSALNPNAQFRKPLSVDQVLGSRSICEPLTLFMCSSMADGAAAAILVSDRFVRRCGASKRNVGLATSALASGSFDISATPETRSGIARLAERAYEQAGVGPESVDVAEVHDAAASSEWTHVEDLGFCDPGAGYRFISDGDAGLAGRLPVNPSGGLIGRGHPVAATGIAQVAELVTQIRGEAGPRQIGGGKAPKVGVALNTGGRIGEDRAALAMHVLVG
jgi:acetyl-CoA acetyltransferase